MMQKTHTKLIKWRPLKALVVVISTFGLGLTLSACAPTMVTNISFPLEPVAAPDVPEALLAINLGAIATASGDCSVHFEDSMIAIAAAGLPTLPTGYRYEVDIEYAENERGELPVPEATEFFPPDPEEHPEAEVHEEDTTTHELESHGDGDGDYGVEVDAATIGDRTLTSVRAASVYIVSTDETVKIRILRGAVSPPSAGEGPGHPHGV